MRTFLILLGITFTTLGYSQQLTYKPINPSFGGDPFNYQSLLSSAEAQNKFKEKTPERGQGAGRGSEIDNFSENLNRQLLSQISRKLLTSQLGDEDLKPGNFSFGSLEVDVYDSTEGLVINILDTNTGEQTQVIVPN